jgi:hypothetical protein
MSASGPSGLLVSETWSLSYSSMVALILRCSKPKPKATPDFKSQIHCVHGLTAVFGNLSISGEGRLCLALEYGGGVELQVLGDPVQRVHLKPLKARHTSLHAHPSTCTKTEERASACVHAHGQNTALRSSAQPHSPAPRPWLRRTRSCATSSGCLWLTSWWPRPG